jgi:pilus assembly protein Flp/PilA
MSVRDAASRRESKNNNRGDAAQTTRTTGSGASSGEEIMFNLINFVKSFSNQEDGQDLLEYALLVALIALVAVGAVTLAGGQVSAIFTAIAGALPA